VNETSQPIESFEECYDEFCCSFKISYELEEAVGSAYRYAMAVFHGNRTYSDNVNGAVFACAIIACETDDVTTCGVKDDSLDFGHKWSYMEVTGTFPYGDEFFYMPSSLDESLMPFDVEEFDYKPRLTITSK
jgi:pantetheine hydrolase